MKNKKHIGILAATLSTGMALGAVTNELAKATGEPTSKTVSIEYWLNDNTESFVEKEILPELCSQLKQSNLNVTDCNAQTLRKEEICIRYLDSDRDGQADKWRAQGYAIIQGVFVPKK